MFAKKNSDARGKIICKCTECDWSHEEEFLMKDARDTQAPYNHSAKTGHTVECKMEYSYSTMKATADDLRGRGDIPKVPSIAANNVPEVPIPKRITDPLDRAFQTIALQITTADHIQLKALKEAVAIYVFENEAQEMKIVHDYVNNLPDGVEPQIEEMIPHVRTFLMEYSKEALKNLG